jgi:hypothetical protein
LNPRAGIALKPAVVPAANAFLASPRIIVRFRPPGARSPPFHHRRDPFSASCGEWSPTREHQNEGNNHMKTTDPGTIETVKDQIVAAITGAGDIVEATVGAVSGILVTTFKDTGKAGKAATDAIASVTGGAIHGAAHVGADLGHAAKGIMLGVLRGTKAVSADALDTISHTAHVAIRDTAGVGGDVEAATTGLITGAIEGAKDSGVSAEKAASAAAEGALKAAGKVGAAAVASVRKAVSKPVKGVKVVLKEPTATGASK